MQELIDAYQQAYRKRISAEHTLEELRHASIPYLSQRVDTEWDEEGEVINWHSVWTRDKAILRKFKDFQSQVTIVSSLCQKANVARRKMIEAIDQHTEGDSI